jgi:hypothetical protein
VPGAVVDPDPNAWWPIDAFAHLIAEIRWRLSARGWEEWELDKEFKVKASLGWFDAEDCARQVEGR